MPSRRYIALAGAGAGVVFVGGLLAVAIVDETAARFSFDGRPVRGAPELLAEADRSFLRAAAREGASVAGGARCWFSRPGIDADVAAALRCGPIVHFGGDPDRAWDHLALRSRPVSDGVVLATTGEVEDGLALDDGESLARPDGRRPPADARLGAPPPPRLAPGQLVVADRVDDVELRPVATGGAVAPVGDVRVGLERIGVAGTAELDGEPRRAARGEELVVAVVEVRGRSGAALEVVTGARRSAPAEPLGPGRHTLVSSTPLGVDTTLEVTVRGISQALSLRTGRPVGARSAVLAERRRAAIGLAVGAQEALSPIPPAADRPPGLVRHGPFTVAEAVVLAHSQWLGTAPPGQAWLAVVLDGFRSPSVPGAEAVAVDAGASFTAVLPGGAEVPAVELGRPDAGTTAYFLVPEDVRAAVLRITPTFAVRGEQGAGRLAFGPVEVAAELQPSSDADEGVAA